ncbi:MAG: hypothetical protein GH154_04370 [Firmicutes bacterium]|nr:hypothetical protein [Bacillota bacterium]
MEEGKFQDFCLDFLPLFDSSYKGLERHGGTVEGKTRKGTPDLIKTLNNGKQIAVQCSVTTDYWKSPKDKSNYFKWKPCNDIDKCLKNLNNVQEITLCSNQEIPTNNPNAKTDILCYAREKTDAKIALLCCVDIENILIDNIENSTFETIFKNHLPEVYERIIFLKEAQKNKIAIELQKEKAVSLDDILRIATDATRSVTNFKEAKNYALKKIDELKSRFERDPLPKPGSVVRHIPENFPLMKPIGIIQTLLGVPKIGKTFLVAQCANHWRSASINICWFDCPIEEIEVKTLIREISINIWASFLPPDKASELASGIISLQSVDLDKLTYKLEHPTVYVLDNAEELLSTDAIKLFCKLLAELKSLSLLPYIGFVFVSNKSLRHLCPRISSEISAPSWTQTELKSLLSNQLPGCECYQDDKYLEILETMSSGHPLVALALARKFPSIKQLLLSNLKAPSLADEDLAAEVKKLLFEDILTDINFLNYILRLSPLTFKANDKVLNAVAKKINPVIAKPFSLILDKLSGTVIEGDERQGYRVAFVYKEVAKEKLTSQQQQEIYDVVSLELLKPKGKVLNTTDVTEGVFYALLSRNFERVFYWTIALLQSAINKKLPKTQMHAIIDRLKIVTLVDFPDDPKLLPNYYRTLISMAMAYSYIENYNKALELLDKIRVPTMKYDDKTLENHLILLSEVAKVYKMSIIPKDDPVKAIRILSELNFDKIKKFLPIDQLHIGDLIKILFSLLPIKQIPQGILKKVANSINLSNEKSVADLLAVTLSLSVKAKREKISLEEAIALLPSNTPIGKILHVIFEAQYALEKQESKQALIFIQQAIALCQENRLWTKSVENIIRQLQGDAYYKLEDSENAKDSYLRCLESLGSNIENFDYAWANYRLGLLSADSEKAEKYFRKSSFTFNSLGYENLYARSEGERGAALVQLGRPLEFVRIAEWMCRRYYLSDKVDFGPAVTVILSQLARLTCDLEGKAIPESDGKICLKFERGVYEKVLEIAKPQAGGLTAFYSLAGNYALVGNIGRKIKSLRTALRFELTNQIDTTCKPLVVKELLSELIPNGDKNEIKNTIIQGIFIKGFQIRCSRDFLSLCVFLAFDNILPKLNSSQKSNFVALLSDIESILKDSQHDNPTWWLAEIYLRKARLAEEHLGKKQKHHLWNTAYQNGCESHNYEIIIQAAHFLSFNYCDFVSSVKDLVEIHFSLIKAISSQNHDLKRLETVGINLFNLWRKIGFRRLSIDELKAKQALMDGAKSLEAAGFSPNNAAPIMILLLLNIYDYKEAAVNWAIEKVRDIKRPIPKDVQERIKETGIKFDI